ncbi:MAG TPA: GxxExxY protein [Vicinamibacterales bacterium]|nr:GxxExxY protein [Vicinamibacterales bacterium]
MDLRPNAISQRVIGVALDIHRELGPGLLESSYEECFALHLLECGLPFERQKALPLIYRGVRLNCGYRVDLIVADTVVVEVKAVERRNPVHTAQVLAYLKLSGRKLGLLFNFNVKWLLEGGVKRIVNGLEEDAIPG